MERTHAELPELLASNLDDGFDAMVRAHQDGLFAFALSMTGSSADAQEVAQDAFVRAYRALRTYPGDRIRDLQVRAWLRQIALNVFRNSVRRPRLRVVPLDGEAVVDGAAGPADIALRSARQRELIELLATLPSRQRAAVVMRCVEDMPLAEVAAALDRPLGTVKSDVHRGLLALRGRLEQREEVTA